MSHTARLVITHGTTDLQLLLRCTETGRLLRATPDKALVRRWHHWLRGQLEQGQACVIDLPSNLDRREHEATITDFADEQHALWLQDYSTPEAYPERNADGKLQLLLPKIQPALSHWLKQHAAPAAAQAAATAAAQSPPAAAQQRSGASASTRKPAIERVLVLSTDRGENEQQEPIATFSYLRHWLEHTHGPLQEPVEEFIFLRTGERLESATSPIDPGIAQRLEEKLRDFYQQKTKEKPETKYQLLLAHEGGLPKIKDLLDEYAALLAPERTVRLLRTERGSTGVLGLTPIDALRTRRICLEQVRRGNLLDAYACAAPFYNEESAKSWVQPLKQAASLINGNPIGSVGSAATLPALQRIIDNAKKAPCLLVAVRVESALLGQRWIEAFIGSTTFLDVALHYTLLAWAKEHAEKINTHRNEIWLKKDPSLDLIEVGALIDRRTPTHKNRYEYNLSNKKAQECWCQAFNIKELKALFYTIYPSSGRKLSDYRNTATHKVMKQDEVREAIAAFTAAKLWSENLVNYLKNPKPKDDEANQYPAPGECFLDRELIKAVLQHFLSGIDPAKLYRDLIEQLEQRLIQPTQAQGSETRANAAP